MLKWGVGLIWLGIGLTAALRSSRGESRGGYVCGALGLALASAVTLRWHVDVLYLVRDGLMETGIYAQRGAIKLGIALVLVAGVLVGARLVWPWLRRQPKGLRLSLLTMLAFGIFLFALTSFLDALLPSVVQHPPGRYLLELCFASIAAVGIATWRERAPHG